MLEECADVVVGIVDVAEVEPAVVLFAWVEVLGGMEVDVSGADVLATVVGGRATIDAEGLKGAGTIGGGSVLTPEVSIMFRFWNTELCEYPEQRLFV